MLKETKNTSIFQYPSKFINPQTTNLIRQINRAVLQNKKIHSQIIQLDPKFTHKLYEPIKHQGIDDMFVKPLILRQIDQLLQEKQTLLTRKEMLNFMIMEQKNKKQKQIQSSATHYSFLRNTWTRLQLKGVDSSQRIDNLNKIVGIVKNNIKQITQNQQNSINKQINSNSNDTITHTNNHNICYLQQKKYQKQRQQLQKYKMRNEQLQTKNYELNKIINDKNKKIQILQNQLYQAGNRIKQSIQTLQITSQKLQNMKKIKNNLQNQIKKLQNLSNQNQYMLFSSITQDFKIKIQTSIIKQFKLQQTHRTLSQIIQFLTYKFIPSSLTNISNGSNVQLTTQQTSSQPLIPCLNLNLNLNLNHTQSTNQTATTTVLSDRYFAKTSKFIPMRSQRSCLLRNQNNKQINNSQSAGQENQQLCNMYNDGTAKRFNRRVQFPLTSERFRKSKIMEEHMNSLGRIQE